VEDSIIKTGIPREILGDHGSDLKAGVERFCQQHPETWSIYDIKHTTAVVLKHELHEDLRWQEFTGVATHTKQRVQQTALAFLAPPNQRTKARSMNLESLLPNLASALLADARAMGPTKWEVAFLDPERPSKATPLQDGWTRTLLALEGDLGPVDLDLGGGRALSVAGKIDRLERWEHVEGLAFLRVTGYKTSRERSLEAYAEEAAPFGSHLQTPLYMRIAETVHGCPATAVLLPLREEEPAPFAKHLRTLALEEEAGSWRERLNQNLARFDARLEAGDFPPTPGEHCKRCELSALCGRPVDVAADGEED